MPPVPTRQLLPGGRAEVLGLYKQLLEHARRFPSKKKDAIYQDIRAEFRENARLSDPAAIAHALEVAVRGIGTMSKYTRLDKKAKDWKLELEQDPLGAAEAQARKAAALPAQPQPQQSIESQGQGQIVDAGVKTTFGRLE